MTCIDADTESQAAVGTALARILSKLSPVLTALFQTLQALLTLVRTKTNQPSGGRRAAASTRRDSPAGRRDGVPLMATSAY